MLRSVARVASVGGLVSGAALIKTQHDNIQNIQTKVDQENTKKQFPAMPQFVSNTSATDDNPEDFVDTDELSNMLGETVHCATASKPNETSRVQAQAEKLKSAINRANNMVRAKMLESGAPGLVIAVSVNGKTVWQAGYGYADLENHVTTGTGCVMRIASISKSITMAVVARLWQENKLDLDKSVSEYVPEFPR